MTPDASFVHLRVQSAFSFLEGTSTPEALVAAAVAQGYQTLALTDRNGLYGIPRFVTAAQAAGIRPIIGATLELVGGSRLTLLVRDATGWANLCRLLSTGQLAGEKDAPLFDLATLTDRTAGLIALTGPDGEPAQLLAQGQAAEATTSLRRLKALFGGAVAVELWEHHLPADVGRTAALVELARTVGVKLVATNRVLYATPDRKPLHDVLTCLRHHTTLAEAGPLLAPNAEAWLKGPAAMRTLFAEVPEAMSNTVTLAEQCQFALGTIGYHFPTFALPAGETPFSYLHSLCHEGARRRYQPLTPAVSRQLAHELEIIQRLELAEYFLIVWDLVRFAHEQGILCQGRGSAANSVVAYALGITNVDPIAQNLLFERFLSEERAGVPDIDLDFANKDRERVIQYVYERYGRDRVGMVAEVIAYRPRSAVRDVGKALGFPPAQLDRLAKALDRDDLATAVDAGLGAAGLVKDSLPIQHLRTLCAQLEGLPRHLSIHPGGMVLTAKPITEVLPLERARMADRTIVPWDKDDLEDLGFCKIDLLGLGMLSLISDCLALLRAQGRPLDLSRLAPDDPAVYDLICTADTIGVFQVESRAQLTTIPRLQPRTFYDLVIQVSLIRPGPIQGGSVNPYLRRRRGEEPVTYPHPALEAVLAKTLGVPLFQEQGMKIAVALAGFRPGEADALRRAMGRKRSREQMAILEAKFLAGCARTGIEPAVATHVWQQMAAFADYGFPESHACSFALIVYQSAYLKKYCPVEFYVSLLNNQPMGFYSPEVIVGDARRHNISVLPVDITCSRYDCTVEDGALRLGYRMVHGIGERFRDQLDRVLADGPFTDLADFCRRSGLARDQLVSLAQLGAFAAWEPDRRRALWQLERVRRVAGDTTAPGLATLDEERDQRVPLRATTPHEAAVIEYATQGFSPSRHLLEFARPHLQRQQVTPAAAVPAVADGRVIRIAGLVVARQRPETANGFVFVCLEDETGLVNVILRPDVYARYRSVVRTASLLLIEGELQRRDGAINVLARRVAAVPTPASERVVSKSFH